MIQIECPIPAIEDDCARLTANVSCDRVRHKLYYSIPAQYADWFVADRCDGFVVGLVFQAMQRNEEIRVEGPLSSRLYHSLQNFFIPMMSSAFLNLNRIDIIPSVLIDNPASGQGVATGFSGGVDSFAAVIQHLIQERSTGHKITHFLFHNVGSHGHGSAQDARKLFWQRYEKVKPFVAEAGIPIVPVDSNLSELIPTDFIKTHSALNVSIPLVLQNQFKRYYYASTYKYQDCGVNRIDDVARFDPLAFHLFSTEGLDCVSTGCQMSRVEKTQLVASYEPSWRHLNVCVDPAFEGRNCSVCFKCCRTLMTLELLGADDSYREVFDLEKFRTIRMHYLFKILRYTRGSFEAEIAELFREKRSGPLVLAFKLRHAWDRLTWR